MSSSTARALANLALVKYFGKRDVTLNLPAAGSLSLTLEPLSTTTAVTFDTSLEWDCIQLDGEDAPTGFAERVIRFLDLVRTTVDTQCFARVTTQNSFPTAAGLASSAAGFAALAVAATTALGQQLTPRQLSVLARQGSGSACRSISGGISVWQAGKRADGEDSFATAIAGPDWWDLRVVIGITDAGPKSIGSTAAMEQTRRTSPFYGQWIETVNRDLVAAGEAVKSKRFEQLGAIAEHNALAMHAAALAARPAIVLWNGATVEALKRIQQLRADGIPAYFTCDAGPQPKALCLPADEDDVALTLADVPGVQSTIRCRIGGAPTLV